MITMNVAFPKELHRRLAIQGIDDNASMNELIRKAVREYLDRRTRSRKKREA